MRGLIRSRLRLGLAANHQRLKQLAGLRELQRTRKEVVLVHQMGKVGSTAVLSAVNRESSYLAVQLHRLTPQVRAEMRQRSAEARSGIRYVDLLAPKVNQLLATGRIKRIVCLARDPVARSLSDYFHNLELYVARGTQRHVSVADLIETFLRHYDFDSYNRWFEHELWNKYNLSEFRVERENWGIRYSDGGKTLVIIKSELSDDQKNRILSQFLDREIVIDRDNVLAVGPKAVAYKQFRADIRIPDEVLEYIYTQPWVKLIYGPDEIAAFYKKWKA